MKLKEINTRILELYASGIKEMAPVKTEYDKQKLQGQACRMGLVRWTDRQRQKVGAVGFLTGLPGGLMIIPMTAGDVVYLMAVAGRGCYGVGHILKRQVDYDRDIPMILAVWSGAAHVASAATVGQVALHVANPIIIHTATIATITTVGPVITTAVGPTGIQVLNMIMPNVLAKIGAKLAAKTFATIIPIVGGFVSCGVNWWICGGLMRAAEKYYLADFVVLNAEPSA